MAGFNRSTFAAAVVVLGAVALTLVPMDLNVIVAVFVGVGLVAVIIARSGGDAFDVLRAAAAAARRGEALPSSRDIPSEAARVFDELERVAEVCRDAADVPALRRENGELTERLQQAQKLVTELEQQLSQSAPVPAGKLTEAVELVESETVTVRRVCTKNGEIVERASSRVDDMSGVVRSAGEHVTALTANAQSSAGLLSEMTATHEQMVRSVGELGASVRESVSSMEEMAYSIKEVARNIDALSLTAEETSTSMNQMDVSIDQVQSNANETARLSEEVARDAEQGAESILKTIGEIYRIKESSQEAVSVISDLGSRIDAIGQILNVIDEVAEQTNLLALNAAIIAAQAGEHGKGFAVVADEIKDLAERAGVSTKEIAELIKTIQTESRNAIQAVERGAQNVDRGVQVSNEAERALKKILESSQKSTEMVRAIARATVEQAKGSRQVTDSIGRIAETVQQIAAATAEQARGSELIMTSGEKMRSISQQVERSSQEQARGGRQTTQGIEKISKMLQELQAVYKSQDFSGAAQVAEELREGARMQAEALARLQAAAERARRLLP